jgi:hypothetical protein
LANDHNSPPATGQLAAIKGPGATMRHRLWRFIRSGTNRAILSWLGGGAAVIVAGTWTLFLHFHDEKKPPAPAAPSTTVIAPGTTGIISGHDTVFHAPVTIGLDEKQVGQQITNAQKPLTEQLEQLAAQVARDKGVEVAPLRAILLKLGEAGVGDADVAKRLDEKADELINLREEIAKLRQGPAELATYAQQAQALIDKGDFDGARAALASGRAAAHTMREQSSRYEAQFLAQDAKIDHLRLAYRSAAAKYADAARLMETVDQRRQWQLLYAQARELYSQGFEFGDNAALVESIAVDRDRLLLSPRAQHPLAWAAIQNDLGNALWTLGGREGGTAHLEEAVAAYREALMERTRELVPLDWATTQNNLGNALATLCTREVGTAHLEEAVVAYREALMERTRERVPLDWAKTQGNLGNALEALGARESGTARIEEAVAAYRDALKELTRERVPLDWAKTQDNLGNALWTLGARESGTAHLEEAIAAYRDALTERTRERVPLDWAATQNNLGVALAMLGARESGTAHLEAAIAAYGDALMERTRERVPLGWAATQNNLGIALMVLGEREGGTGRLEQAIVAYGEALKEFTRERIALQWAVTTANQGVALRLLAERRVDLAMADLALTEIAAAFDMLRDAHPAPNAAFYEAQLGAARDLVERLRKG